VGKLILMRVNTGEAISTDERVSTGGEVPPGVFIGMKHSSSTKP